MQWSLGSQLNNAGRYTICWNFSNEEQVPFPVIEGLLADAKASNAITMKLKVDTGFNGVLGLPGSAIERLQLIAKGHTIVRSATGEKRLEYYEVNLSIPETPYVNMKAIAYKTPRPILGRMVLNLGTWLYDGENKTWCLI